LTLTTEILMSDINAFEYDFVITKLRDFFVSKSFVEVPTQSRLSILAACEDPKTISDFHFANEHYPLPQTGQMWLERELLSNPKCPGFYCISTSYRNEKNPIAGRHNLIFPMFEFELPGNIGDLKKLETELLTYLGFTDFKHLEYLEAAKRYNVKELTSEHETLLDNELGSVVFLELFPEYTSPFWNMKRHTNNKELANKIDVIIHGMETIGSAERSSDKEEMRHAFHTISNGEYANILYSKFTKERVEKELESFLDFDFFDRSGGGIGITRLIRAMKLSGLLKLVF
jgi:aspartyl/asparaginyl-tRNA synthetase